MKYVFEVWPVSHQKGSWRARCVQGVDNTRSNLDGMGWSEMDAIKHAAKILNNLGVYGDSGDGAPVKEHSPMTKSLMGIKQFIIDVQPDKNTSFYKATWGGKPDTTGAGYPELAAIEQLCKTLAPSFRWKIERKKHNE
jgi:hypothetical protein